jgi:hypothetical protein
MEFIHCAVFYLKLSVQCGNYGDLIIGGAFGLVHIEYITSVYKDIM